MTQNQGPAHTERRGSPRIKCQFSMEYRVLTKSQHDMLRPLYLSIPTRMRESSSRTVLAQPSKQSTPSPDQTVIQLLLALHEKMDALFGFLTHEPLSGLSLDDSPLERASCVELCENGLRMTGYRRTSVGDFIDLRLRLLGGPAPMVRAIGQVVYEITLSSQDQKQAGIVLTAVHHEDRAQLNHYCVA